ncbi:hypothetical protein [Sphingobium abikonense]|uniref:hypothetical protein n=1 Tax=Sphingobium abikonense TaxID=86193 RepID=UPI003515A7C0
MRQPMGEIAGEWMDHVRDRFAHERDPFGAPWVSCGCPRRRWSNSNPRRRAQPTPRGICRKPRVARSRSSERPQVLRDRHPKPVAHWARRAAPQPPLAVRWAACSIELPCRWHRSRPRRARPGFNFRTFPRDRMLRCAPISVVPNLPVS